MDLAGGEAALPGRKACRHDGRQRHLHSVLIYMLLTKRVAINVWTLEVTGKEQRNEHIRQPDKCLVHVTDMWVCLCLEGQRLLEVEFQTLNPCAVHADVFMSKTSIVTSQPDKF